MGRLITLVLFWCMMSIVKFLLAPSSMLASTTLKETSWMYYDWNPIQIILITSTGAAIGCFLFYKFGEQLFRWMESRRRKPKRLFSKGSRFIAGIRSRYGLMGLLMIAGVISVPISALLAAKYYRGPRTLVSLMAAFVCWSVVLTGISWVIKSLF